MASTATIRELRNQFPKVRKLIEDDGEVIVTEHGTPKYRLMPYRPDERTSESPVPKDYMARLRRHQPRQMSAAAAQKLHDANRGTG